jgi:hypothetical protein
MNQGNSGTEQDFTLVSESENPPNSTHKQYGERVKTALT